MSDATIRVALYIKATTTDQAARREDTLREYAGNQPSWRVVLVFADLGEARRRLALKQAFAAAETGRFDLLLVDSIEKLTGAPRVREIVERFHEAGVTARSLAGFDSTFPLSMQFLSTVDEFHARWLQRVRLGREPGAQQAHASTAANFTRTGPADRQSEVVAVQALYAAVSDDRRPWLEELLITAGVLRRCDCTAMAPAGRPCPVCGTPPRTAGLAVGEKGAGRELSFEEAGAAGLDGTGRDGDSAFPYTTSDPAPLIDFDT
jgi:hypothetical protein